MSKNYLVTGAAGFIGAAVARRLVQEGNQVVTIDNMSTGFQENIPDKVELIEGNCADPKIIKKLAKYSFDAIFHIAGQGSAEISFEDPVYDLQTNTLSTLLLLQYAQEFGCNRFIYASTMSVYGDQPDQPVCESARSESLSFYAVSKHTSEHYMRIYTTLGITNTALRLFTTYGPGQNMKNKKQGMVSIFLAQAIEDKIISVRGSPDRYRDFVFVDEVVDAFSLAEKFADCRYRCLNIGTGKRTTIRDLINLIKTKLPFEVEVEFSGFTPGDQFGIYADITETSKILRWSPTISLDKGLNIMIDAVQ